LAQRFVRCFEHSMPDFTELGRNSMLAADSWMMANPSNIGKAMQ
jgi:hypothetical protein